MIKIIEWTTTRMYHEGWRSSNSKVEFLSYRESFLFDSLFSSSIICVNPFLRLLLSSFCLWFFLWSWKVGLQVVRGYGGWFFVEWDNGGFGWRCWSVEEEKGCWVVRMKGEVEEWSNKMVESLRVEAVRGWRRGSDEVLSVVSSAVIYILLWG